ncbi:MAG: amino acid ABC transporter substrate-binding protein [Streptococcaceae bacterium]|jgi:polar amino acid transport system substrate-binding protein|nr:amino acid ABC transporter substrate-binding protein [Streptococcaceae bacterium]
MKKKIIMLLIIAVSLVSFSACTNLSKQDTLSVAKKQGYVTIGFDDTFVPMGFKDKSGKFTGFDVALANAVFKHSDIVVRWQPITWAMKETELKAGHIDLIWNGYTMTPEREKLVSFSKPYMANAQVLVVKKTSGIVSSADMAGKSLGLQTGSSEYDSFNNKPEIFKNIVKDNKAALYSTFDLAFIDLKADRIQGLFVDGVYADYYLQKTGLDKDFVVLPTGFPDQDFAVGARKNDQNLIGEINETLADMHKSGEFQKISEKWFGKDIWP